MRGGLIYIVCGRELDLFPYIVWGCGTPRVQKVTHLFDNVSPAWASEGLYSLNGRVQGADFKKRRTIEFISNSSAN